MAIIERTQFLLDRYKNDPESITDVEFKELMNSVEEIQVRFALSARVMASAIETNNAAMKEMIMHMGSFVVQLDKSLETWKRLGVLDAEAKATFIEVKEDEVDNPVIITEDDLISAIEEEPEEASSDCSCEGDCSCE